MNASYEQDSMLAKEICRFRRNLISLQPFNWGKNLAVISVEINIAFILKGYMCVYVRLYTYPF